MKLKYLGTAAAEGIPGLFCNCRVCQNAIQARGKEIKTRSQAIIDGKLLIDFPADTYMHILNYGLDLREVNHCIITHAHHDHFHPEDLWCRFEGMAHGISDEPFHVYVTEAGYKQAEALHGERINSERLRLHRIFPFEALEIDEYRVIPLRANHDPGADPVFYIIESVDKTLLYANDTGIFPEETWKYLENYKRKFDLVSLDCTAMALPNWRNGHMGLDTCKELYDRLCKMGLCDEKTVAYVNHFSHNGGLTHGELIAEAAKLGFGATYDGLEAEF